MTQLILQPDPTTGIDCQLANKIFVDVNAGLPTTCTIGTSLVSKTLTFYRALIRFDLSTIPAGSAIDGATLTLFNSGGIVGAHPESFIFTANRVTQPAWTELGATWNSYVGGSLWAAPGGDFTTSGHDTFAPGDDAEASDDVLFSDLSVLAADAVANRGGRLDLLVVGPENLDDVACLVVFTSDYTSDPEKRPKLVITYTPPLRRFQSSMAGGMQELSGLPLGS